MKNWLTRKGITRKGIARKGIASSAFTLLLIVLVTYQFGSLIYMNVRPSDPILPGWEEFDEARFQERAQAGESVLLEVYASWCPTCLAQHKAFEQLIEDGRQPAIRAVRLDFDRDADFRNKLGVHYTGVLLLLEGNRIVASQSGLTDPDSINTFLQRYGYAQAKSFSSDKALAKANQYLRLHNLNTTQGDTI